MDIKKIIAPKPNQKLVSLLLRLGLAAVFAYAAIDSLVHPNDWVGYMPHSLTTVVGADALLKILSVYQLALVCWLLVGRYVRYAAALCTLTLVGIIATNLGVFAITFRDVGLVFAAAALFFLERE